MFYLFLKHLHSGLRWLVLAILILAIISSVYKLFLKRNYKNADRRIAFFSMVALHLQFLIGIILYLVSPKVVFAGSSMSNSLLRFFLVEHIALMMIAVILITIGYSKAMKISDDSAKHTRILVFYLIGFILILLAIPWPWMSLGGSWF